MAFVAPVDKMHVVSLTGVSVLFALPKIFLGYILQATNRIKEYSTLVITEKLIYGALVVLLVLLHNTRYELIIFADLAGKIFSLILYFIGVVYFASISLYSF